MKHVINTKISIFINNMMKKITLLITTIFLINACSQNEQEVDSTSESFVEYVWHKSGPDFSAENLAMLINKWNGMIDGMQCKGMTGANILTPEVESDGYDFIWVLLWNSKSSRDECWDDWTTNKQPEWDVIIDGIMQPDFDNVYLFESKVGQRPNIENTSGQFVNEFNFCNYNEGFSDASLETFKSDISATNWSDSYWYVLLEPQFEQTDPKPDFVWLNLWANSSDKEMAQTKYFESDLPSTSGAAFECNPVAFSGVAIRR